MLLEKATSVGLCETKIEKAARARLTKTGYPLLNTITCNFHDGILTLEGDVHSYYHKQVAQEAMRKVDNVEAIVNQIHVSY